MATTDSSFGVVADGKSQATITTIGPELSGVSYAAEELQSYIADITDVTLAISDTKLEDMSTKRDLCGVMVFADDAPSKVAPENLLKGRPLEDAGDEGYMIRATEDAVLLVGFTGRACLYAVYDLIETLGVHFYAPDFPFYENHFEHIPEKDTLTVPQIDRVEVPDVDYRILNTGEAASFTPESLRAIVDWMPKARRNVLMCGSLMDEQLFEEVLPAVRKRDLLLRVGGHCMDEFLSKDEYGEEHPEWFIENHNVFDTRKEDAVKTLVSNVIDYLENNPDVSIFGAWPPDGSEWPAAVIEEFGSRANAYAHVIGEVNAAIQNQFPNRNIVVEALAYGPHIQPPDDEYMYADSMMVHFATMDRSYATSIFDSEVVDAPGDSEPKNPYYVNLLREWADHFDGELLLHEYYRKYSWHSLPGVPQLMAEEIPQYVDAGINGISMVAEPADWITYELPHLLLNELAWDTSLDSDAWVETYLQDRYGSFSDSMAEYLELSESAGRSLFRCHRLYRRSGTLDRDLANALEKYKKAREILDSALENGDTGPPGAEMLLSRLKINLEFAIADTELEIHSGDSEGDWRTLAEDSSEAEEARKRVVDIINDHALEGVILQNPWALNPRRVTNTQNTPDVDPFTLKEVYRQAW
jgi:hypothetical protein